MTKTTSPKKTGKTETTNTAYSKKVNNPVAAAKDNESRFRPTKDAEMDTLSLDPADGLRKLFTDCIRDIYWAENHLVKALPKMAKASSLKLLQKAILSHLDETIMHVQRLEQVFELLGIPAQARKCDAMEGLTKEGESVVETTDAGTAARDLGIIMASQKIEHYEISSYTGLAKLASNLDFPEISGLLSATLAEEEASDKKLAEIAENNLSEATREEEEEV